MPLQLVVKTSGSSSPSLMGEQARLKQLAVAVIRTADEDLKADISTITTYRGKQEATRMKAEALAFLTGGPMLALWCELAGYNPDAVQEQYRRLYGPKDRDAA